MILTVDKQFIYVYYAFEYRMIFIVIEVWRLLMDNRGHIRNLIINEAAIASFIGLLFISHPIVRDSMSNL